MNYYQMRRCVLGSAGLGGIWRAVDPDESVRAMVRAIEGGMGGIDTAPAYGDAEVFVGRALRQWAGPAPAISTKVGRLKSFATDDCRYDYSERSISESVHSSLKIMGVEAIDILLLHEPSAVDERILERVIRQLQGFKQAGVARKIGLGGNFPDRYLPYLEEGTFDVVIEYNRLNACNVDALKSTIPLCMKAGVDYYAASPLNMGLLGRNYDKFIKDPPAWLSVESVAAARRAKGIADEHAISLQELSLRFLLSIPLDFKIVTGASDLREVEETLQFIDRGPLPDAVYDELLQSLNKGSK